tara:strand:+ start:1760 stop:1954 length:195 start_codon:yes stop_codon:yes gene_type:complete
MYIYLITYQTTDGAEHATTVTADNDHPSETIAETKQRAETTMDDIAKRPDVVFTKMTSRLVPGI